MARRARQADPTAKAARVLTNAATLPKRLDARIQPFATGVGWCGIGAIATLAFLATRPESDWPLGLVRSRMPIYATLALVTSSLLGWAFMQQGQGKLERRLGRTGAMWLFVILPIAAAAISIAEQFAPLTDRQRGEWAAALAIGGRFGQWYSPAAVVVSLWAFLEGKSRSGPVFFLHLALLLPFAALLGALVFGFPVPWVDDSLRQTLRTLGGGAIAVQIILAWFVGGTR